ncbi:MAG TPA: dienelactone hydrolase family protein [Polyangiaceae bacterium]
MSTMEKFSSKSGEVAGAIAAPAGTAKAGGLVVIQEWHGVNDQMKGKVDRFAKEGFLSLCPDLYHGKVATNDQDAAALMNGLDWGRAVQDIGGAVAHLRAHARCNGKVGVLGFCMGGALAFAAALNVDGLSCAVPFYGLPSIPPDQLAKIKIPVQAHFAKRDEWAKASVAEEVQTKIRAAGGQMDLYVYDAGHAFMRETDPSKYDAPSADAAWKRALDFLRKHLG